MITIVNLSDAELTVDDAVVIPAPQAQLSTDTPLFDQVVRWLVSVHTAIVDVRWNEAHYVLPDNPLLAAAFVCSYKSLSGYFPYIYGADHKAFAGYQQGIRERVLHTEHLTPVTHYGCNLIDTTSTLPVRWHGHTVVYPVTTTAEDNIQFWMQMADAAHILTNDVLFECQRMAHLYGLRSRSPWVAYLYAGELHIIDLQLVGAALVTWFTDEQSIDTFLALHRLTDELEHAHAQLLVNNQLLYTLPNGRVVKLLVSSAEIT